MSDNLSDVRAGVDGIMSAYIDQAVEPAGHVTWKINLSQIAPDSNAVNAVANCVPAKRRKRQSQRSKGGRGCTTVATAAAKQLC